MAHSSSKVVDRDLVTKQVRVPLMEKTQDNSYFFEMQEWMLDNIFSVMLWLLQLFNFKYSFPEEVTHLDQNCAHGILLQFLYLQWSRPALSNQPGQEDSSN